MGSGVGEVVEDAEERPSHLLQIWRLRIEIMRDAMDAACEEREDMDAGL
jgi:hypothetical protein